MKKSTCLTIDLPSVKRVVGVTVLCCHQSEAEVTSHIFIGFIWFPLLDHVLTYHHSLHKTTAHHDTALFSPHYSTSCFFPFFPHLIFLSFFLFCFFFLLTQSSSRAALTDAPSFKGWSRVRQVWVSVPTRTLGLFFSRCPLSCDRQVYKNKTMRPHASTVD